MVWVSECLHRNDLARVQGPSEGMTQIPASRRLSGCPPTTAAEHREHADTGASETSRKYKHWPRVYIRRSCLEAETTLQSFTNAITTSNGSNMTYLHLLLLYLHSIRILDWKISFMSLVTICVTAIWTHTYRVETKSFTIWNMTMHCNVALKFKQSQLLLALIS